MPPEFCLLTELTCVSKDVLINISTLIENNTHGNNTREKARK